MSETLTYTVPDMTAATASRPSAKRSSAVAGRRVGRRSTSTTKLVTVVGSALDDAKLRAAIDEAGYEAA